MARHESVILGDELPDVCLVLEGTYPYVSGGVSVWVHDLIRAQSHLKFHIVALVSDKRTRELKFDLPENIVGLTEIVLQSGERKAQESRAVTRLVNAIEEPLERLMNRGDLDDLKAILTAIAADRSVANRANLLNSEAAWAMIVRTYERAMPSASFLDFFWSWRGLAGGLIATLLADLPQAKTYHAVSTGYAGLLLARAVIETGRPGLLTEHGIYTNERRVEIAMADWLHDRHELTLNIEKAKRDLRDLWIDAFVGYSKACYDACSEIITLYRGNQELQRRDGASPERMRVIPNGIDYATLSQIVRDAAPRKPTVALIGRVVPIKDVKTFIRSIGLLRDIIPDMRAVVLGPTDEDEQYYRECRDMVVHMQLTETLTFPGRVALSDWLGKIDAIVLTSISEAQPLVILEAGSAGVPTVATDVGSCREMLFGRDDEDPKLGQGGFITTLSNPLATASALAELLLDPVKREACGSVIKNRISASYDKVVIDKIYGDLYARYIAMSDVQQMGLWQEVA